MKVTFFRHGEAEHNKEYESRGVNAYTDISLKFSNLTENGIFQARARSKDHDIDEFQIVITSSLPRALQTTNIMFGESDSVFIAVCDYCRELDMGHVCNSRRRKSEIEEEYPDINTDYLSEEEDVNIGKKYEYINSFRKMKEIFRELSHIGIKKIAVVTHNDFISRYLGSSFSIPNCGRVDVLM